MHNEKFRTWLYIILLCTAMSCTYSYANSKLDYDCFAHIITEPEQNTESPDYKSIIENIYSERSKTFISGDLSSLSQYFDTSQKYGRWSLEHEVMRVKYLRDWAYQREIKFTNVESTVRLKKVYPSKETIKLALDETYKFDYLYEEDAEPTTNSFGVGIRHTVTLKKKNNNWLIYSDWYTDCFEDALKSYNGEINNISTPQGEKYKLGKCTRYPKEDYPGRYKRIKAVQYADTYCGAAWGSGNNYKYNKKYKDFTGIGGDCTNFASQVLGDKEAGNLRFDGTWYCVYSKYGGSPGSRAWVNTDELKSYLIYSGKGTVVKKGSFKDIMTPTQDYPCGAAQKLELGDLICYAKNGDIDHFAVLTGWDSHGYPLINSHTTDRYHVPWDLGWGDKGISFYLIHIR